MCTLLLRSCVVGRGKDAEGALAIWQAMRAAGRWPTVPGLQHLLVACADAGQWHAALDALRACELPSPEGGGLATDVRQWNAVLQACVRGNALREAEALLLGMPGGAAAPDAVSYNTLLHGYAREWGGGEGPVERHARARELLLHMESAGVRRDEATYAALLDLHKLDPCASKRGTSKRAPPLEAALRARAQ